MVDMQRAGQLWLTQQLKKHASRMVVYQRGETQIELFATIGKSTYEQDSGNGMRSRAQVRDYLIETDLLEIDGEHFLPRSGDRIREPEGDKTFVYEVMALGDQPPWRYSDVFRLWFRIHTKLISTE